MKPGDILGHEFMGEVVEVGPERAQSSKTGDRVVVPFAIALRRLLLLPARCSRRSATTPTPTPHGARRSTASRGAGSSATPTCSAATRAGRRSTCACRSPTWARSRCPTVLRDEQVLFLSDILPDRVHGGGELQHPAAATPSRCGAAGRWGCWRSRARTCWERSASSPSTGARSGCAWPSHTGKAETLNYEETADVVEELKQRTGGRGPDACIDAVGTGGARHECRRPLRPREARGRPRDRSAARAAPGDPGLPQGRHRVDPGRVRRPARQDPVRRRLRQGPDPQDGPDPRAPLHGAAARAHRGADGSTRASSSATTAGRCRQPPRPTGCSATRPTTA